MGIKEITGVTVCSNTRAVLETAYLSVRRFHPEMEIIIVDGSDARDPCAAFVRELASAKISHDQGEIKEPGLTRVIQPGRNIGHGRGMCLGIDNVRTPFALIFDSDIEMLKSPVLAMLAMMEEDTYGIGYIEEKTGFDGYEWGSHRHHKKEGWMRYLHPFFQLLNIANYRKFHPYVHHGAPCYLAMLDIHKRSLSEKILKQFPGLGHSSGKGWNWAGIPREYIRHNTRGTRDERLRKRQPEIEPGWILNNGRRRA